MSRTALAILTFAAFGALASADGGGHHHSAPAADTYGAPVADTYGAPPAESYAAPAESYGAPAYTAPGGGVDLTMLIIPILALVGLFLLFPTYVTLEGVRKKRSAGDEMETSVYANMVDSVQDIYNSVMESEECLERIACQAGAMAREAGLSASISTGAMLMAPAKYTKYAKQFAIPKNCHKIKCGNLF